MNQIGRWIDTAKKVLKGLDAEDDVEWAAQGRESLNEVDTAVKKFSGLMNVYIELIDELQRRPDSDTVESDVLIDIVGAMEDTVDGWRSVQVLLKGVRDQVETAMEWTELWTTILRDIQAELDACQTLVFELEERRHRTMIDDSGSVDIDTLETIMEDNPGVFPVVNGKSVQEVEDSSLLGLFARMQPLRASLDFLPMRLQSFQMRAEEVFPTACDELDSRRKQLERKWKKLNSDADSLKRELGEDRWVAIFRNAGKQASHMLDSIERSMNKLKESVIAWEESGGRSGQDMQKKMENYEAKKMHYGLFCHVPIHELRSNKSTGVAIQRTFSIVGKGLSDRFTVNGEIIRLDTSLRARWKSIEDQMWELDQALKDLELDAQALRDSISSLNSLEISSGMITPGTSPASSVQPNSPTPQRQLRRKSPAAINTRRPPSVIGSTSSTSSSTARRRQQSNVTTPPTSPWRASTPTTSISMQRVYSSPSAAGSHSSSSSTRTVENKKPRWSAAGKVDDAQIGHNFKPMNLTTPSPYRKTPPVTTAASRRNSSAMGSRLPLPSPLRSATTPTPGQSPGGHLRSGSSISNRRPNNMTSPSPAPNSRPTLRRQSSNGKLNAAHKAGSADVGMSFSDFMKNSNASPSSGGNGGPRINVRPATSMAGRMSSAGLRAGTPAGARSGTATPNSMSAADKRCSMPYGSASGLAWSKEMGAGGKPRWRY